jgi:hypothetical protein
MGADLFVWLRFGSYGFRNYCIKDMNEILDALAE